MSYFIPDLTGDNPAYKTTNIRRRVLEPSQVIPLFTPVYPDSLVVMLDASITVPLVRNIDYVIYDSDYDYHATGEAQLSDMDTNFPHKLIKSFTIIKPFVAPYTIICSWQQLYPDVVEYILENPTSNIEITPAVFWSMLNDIHNLKLATTPIKDIGAETEVSPRLLPPDPNKEYLGNYVDGEHWSVDTSANKNVVFPTAGSFFRDSVKVVRGKHASVDDSSVEPDQVLKVDEDYYISGVDQFGTHRTTNTSGVFNLIIFKKALVDDVTIAYHAYGGDPTLYDMKAVMENITNFDNYVRNERIVTASNIGGMPIMNEFRARMKTLEDEMRRFATSGRPSYGDVTHGDTLVKRITSVDSDLHWWTIAELFKVAGSDTVFMSDMGHFQIQSLHTKLLLDFTFAVNLHHMTSKLQVSTISSLPPDGYIPYVDNSGLENVLRPQLRIIYNDNAVEGSGIYLQFGMYLKGVAEETIAVSDLSGSESCWRLIPEVETAVNPEDDNILLPSGNHYWSIDNPDSKQKSYLINQERGHVCWAGDTALNRPNTGWQTIGLDHFLEDDIDISNIKSANLWLEESESNRFIIPIAMHGDNNNVTGVASFTYANRGASMTLAISRHAVTSELSITLNVEIAAGLNSNRLALRYVHVNT